tara:strand:- start:337 stop:1029 length:693 start_codon:yes stop_codon:yes gene_type:complete
MAMKPFQPTPLPRKMESGDMFAGLNQVKSIEIYGWNKGDSGLTLHGKYDSLKSATDSILPLLDSKYQFVELHESIVFEKRAPVPLGYGGTIAADVATPLFSSAESAVKPSLDDGVPLDNTNLNKYEQIAIHHIMQHAVKVMHAKMEKNLETNQHKNRCGAYILDSWFDYRNLLEWTGFEGKIVGKTMDSLLDKWIISDSGILPNELGGNGRIHRYQITEKGLDIAELLDL